MLVGKSHHRVRLGRKPWAWIRQMGLVMVACIVGRSPDCWNLLAGILRWNS